MRRVLGSFVIAAGLSGSAWAATATIAVDASKPGPKLDPKMYGIFLEEINHGVDGGLYAELIRNRAFEYAKPPEGFAARADGRWTDEKGWDCGYRREADGLPYWSLVKEGDAAGSMHVETEKPLHPNTPHSLRLEIENAGGRLGVANEGFWGIGVAQGERYNLSLYARCEGFSGPLTATLEDAKGQPVSDAVKMDGLGAEWKQFKGFLTGTKAEPKARLVLVAGAKGKVWLDLVSLFPAKTFKNRPNGLRPDLAQMLGDLKPGFVRFPGGCVVEGGSIETAYNWKDTIGPLEERAEKWNCWGYRRTHGMGYLEYLQFCEDIGAEPLHVGFAGQTCLYRHAEHVPMAEMGWVVQGFLDAIEYARGAADTKWGALRAKHGRAEPFPLNLIEIGNENGMREYEERYRLIHPKLKAAYPGITYIADYLIPDAAYDMVDDHFYNSPQWFLEHFTHYDARDRKLAPVYVGEIAVTSPEGGPDKGNLLAALGEGVFLMGAERNADVVRMVSYAPLLAHVSGRSGWHGMIYFDSTRVCGTVSYYLWKLFGLNLPTCTLKTDVEFTSAKQPAIAGAIGVGTWDTAAEFKDIRVEKGGQALYASDLAKGAGGWKTDGGNWAAEDGAYRQKNSVIGVSWIGDEAWSDYTLTLKARKLAGAEGFLILFGRKGEDKYWWNLGGWGNREHGIEFNRTPVGRHVAGKIEQGRWYDIKVALQGRRIRCYLDGKLVHDESAPGTERFYALAGRDEDRGELILKVINTSPDPVATTLSLSGVERVSPEGEVTVLRSERLDDNNSLDNPMRVVPTTSKIATAGARFGHEFPAFSLTVMRLKTK